MCKTNIAIMQVEVKIRSRINLLACGCDLAIWKIVQIAQITLCKSLSFVNEFG